MTSVVFLAACGGGGGGGGGSNGETTYEVQLSASPLKARWYEDEGAAPISFTVKFGALPPAAFYPDIEGSATDFEPGSLQFLPLTESVYDVGLRPKASLPMGVHTGTLTLKLCKDAQCVSAYKLHGASLSYELTVDPGVGVSIKVNGVSLLNDAGEPLMALADDYVRLNIANGSTVELTSRVEADWPVNSNGQPYVITNLVSSPTSWRAVVSGPPGLIDGLSVSAGPKNHDQRYAGFEFTIR